MELRGESAREMEERFAVTAATGALGPVLAKLTALLGDEYKLQEGTRRDTVSIKSDLEPVLDLLGKLWGREDLDVACKDWMAEARELSYDMEDAIDGFTLSLEWGHGGLIQRETTGDPFNEFMERVKGVSKRFAEMQKIGDAISSYNRSQLTTDPRALFLHKDASELVGMESKEEMVVKMLQKFEVVCIVGFAGMGKTTLADLVYHTIGDQFQCRAFVSVHLLSPNIIEILGTILSQVRNGATSSCSGKEPADEQNIINDISISLADKRYLVIIDDIWCWEQWEVIRKALPKNNLGSKIIMTTRISTIAKKCRADAGAHVYVQRFEDDNAGRLSYMTLVNSVEGDIIETHAKGLTPKIVRMSGAMPLAVICLSSAWAESPIQGDYGEWDTWESHVMNRFLTTPSLKPLVQSLCLYFDDLPIHLRTCLLYSSKYPPYYEIERDCLIEKWIVEGFVSQKEVADEYFDKLISRSLLQPVPLSKNKYTVHPIMLAFLVCKAKEDNLFHCCWRYNGPSSSSHAKQIRRLSLYMDLYPDGDVSHTRSLTVVDRRKPQLDGVPFKKFKNLRVLEIDDSVYLENGHLVDICELIWLRYLGLGGCTKITELPQNIGQLRNLETLDVKRTGISKLPKEIAKLQHLETLNISGTVVAELPREITEVERLENLDVSGTEVRELPKDIRKLQHLRTLDVRGTEIRELTWEVPNSLNVLVGGANSSQVVKLPKAVNPDWVISTSGVSCREDLSVVLFNPFGSRSELLPVPILRIGGKHVDVPQWVKQDFRNVCSLHIRIWKLGNDDLKFLKRMPNLQALHLRFEVLPWAPIAITAGGFSKLERFYVDCRLPRVITFEEGAMPKLKHLEFKFYRGSACQGYSMGIAHLQSLENVVFQCSDSEYYTSECPGISATIEVMRKEATDHSKRINLWVNGKKEEFSSGYQWISHEDKATIERRKRLYEAAVERATNHDFRRPNRLSDNYVSSLDS